MHSRARIEIEFANSVDQIVLRWFGRMERMDEQCIAVRVSRVTIVNRRQAKIKLRFDWVDGVKMAFGNTRMTVNIVRQGAKDKKWSEPPHINV